MSDVKLTQYSHGVGCGCKIAPNILEEILHSQTVMPDNKYLIVGNHSKDDAALYDLGGGQALISTTDFFMPIVDDPFNFGRIASANAISDVYAMGGTLILAIAILGWPINMLPPEVARKVIEGSRSICMEAGIPLAGGHSIDAPEPIFGLAVNGLVRTHEVKQNNSATPGDILFLTKPLGVGILTTAVEWSIRKNGAQVAVPLTGLADLAAAEISVLGLVSKRGHLHAFTVSVEGMRKDGTLWTLAVDLPDDRETSKNPSGDRQGLGACSHAAFHCHVGPDRTTAPEVRVPLPALGPVEVLEWVLSQIVPTAEFEPAPWAEVQAALKKASS